MSAARLCSAGRTDVCWAPSHGGAGWQGARAASACTGCSELPVLTPFLFLGPFAVGRTRDVPARPWRHSGVQAGRPGEQEAWLRGGAHGACAVGALGTQVSPSSLSQRALPGLSSRAGHVPTLPLLPPLPSLFVPLGGKKGFPHPHRRQALAHLPHPGSGSPVGSPLQGLCVLGLSPSSPHGLCPHWPSPFWSLALPAQTTGTRSGGAG